MRLRWIAVLCLATACLWAQVTGRLEGTVLDPAGAAVPTADVEVVNPATGQRISAKTDASGKWSVPALDAGTYTVTINASGFKKGLFPGVVIQTGTPAALNATLEIGSAQQTVEVSGAAEVLQSATATVSTTLTGRQITQLPYTSRNAMDIVTSLPGTQTPGTPRTSSINGLPKGSLNMTIDGVNIQDNYLKSSDGYFATIQPKSDTVEEVVVTSAGASAEGTGQGAAQVKFVTKGGTNQFHGGLHWQHRNTALNSNYYFNTLNGLPRDRLILNQANGRLGGPIWRNRVFFFFSWEEFRLPQTYGSPYQTVLTDQARAGDFRYFSGGQVRTVNLYNVARAGRYPSTPDPTVASQLNLIAQLTSRGAGTLQSQGTSDLNRNQFNFQTAGNSIRHFPTVRLDANITSKLHWEFIGNYQSYFANPDAVNGILPIYPGTGTVLGNDVSAGTRRISFSGVTAARYTITPSLTAEARFGLTGGNSIFRDELTPALFASTGGYALNYATSNTTTGTFLTNPYNSATSSRRNSPVKNVEANLSWNKGSHLVSFGGAFTQINLWQSTSNTQLIPLVYFGTATNDPVNTGSNGIFTTGNFPGASPQDLNNAAALYGLLTGRVASINRSVSLDETSKRYAGVPTIDRNRQRVMAYYVADTWRFNPNLTLNLGLRYEVQFPYYNVSGIYSRPGYAGLYGVSGVGNLFRPGVLTGSAPVYNPVTGSTPAFRTDWNNVLPSVGLAYTLPGGDSGWKSWLFGRQNASVFRSGYSISTVREGTAIFTGIWGANQGTNYLLNIDPAGFPADFGPPGSVLLRNGNLPARLAPGAPAYPITAAPGNSLNDFDPNLRLGYVQSWNVSFQRELAKNTVLDVRYVGNHSVGQWRQYNLNEINIYENGFLNQFNTAANNLTIARATNPNSNQFAGLPGQAPVPIITTALGTNTDATTANALRQGQAGLLANNIATQGARMTRLTNAGYPVNLFQVNPTLLGGGSYLVSNSGASTYNALQTEVRRRMTAGLELQGSYAWSKSLTNMFASSSGVLSQPTTLRNPGYDKGPSPWDIRHGFKVTGIYELPIGPGKSFFNSGPAAVRKALEGWQISGVMRIQSGSPSLLRSARYSVNYNANTANAADAGVVLRNMTAGDLQSAMSIRKNGNQTVTYLPQNLIDNTNAAFEVNGRTLANLDQNAPYIAPPSAGQLGNRIFLYGPWGQRFDLSLIKTTKITERQNIEIRAQFLNAFNNTVFYLNSPGNDVNTLAVNSTGPTFGTTQSAYRDITVSGTNDPGGRLIEFVVRYNF